MPPPRIRYAVPQIVEALREIGPVFSMSQLRQLFNARRAEWNLPSSQSLSSAIDYLVRKELVMFIELEPATTPKTELLHYKPIFRYALGSPSPFSVAVSLKQGSYLSHGSAVYIHGLTRQLPKTIYINKEQTAKRPSATQPLSQSGIDRAFANNHRVSNYIFSWSGYSFVQLSGKNTQRLEVVPVAFDQHTVDVTNVDRTLVDIAVRPAYAGGVHEVLEAYRKARDVASVATILSILKKIGHAYPYHQAIGFYMEAAGYGSRAERLKALGLNYDFYLTYRMRKKRYVPSWRLWVPDSM